MSSDMASAKVFGGVSQYNHWSVGVNAGVTSAQLPFFVNSSDDWHAQLGYGASLKDQISHSLAIRLDYMGGKVVGSVTQQSGTGTTATTTMFGGTYFSTKFNQVSLSGVVDIGSISFLHRQSGIIIYASAGLGMDFYKPSFSTTPGATSADQTYPSTVKELDAPLGAGLKFKLSDALDLNVGYTATFVNNYNFSGYKFYPSLAGHYAYSYAGLEYTFGSSSKKNLEWVNPVAMMYDELYDAALRQEVKALEGRVTNVETAVADLKKDSDGDGVSDQFDKCPNTPAGTPVDGSGCPLPKIDTAAFCKYCKGTDTVANTGNVQFDFDSYVLRTSSYPLLDKKSADLKSSGATCTLAGYASSEGTLAHNIQLSKDRANAVKNYLINSGVEAKKLKAKGYGIANPVAPNSTEAGRELNRRVEFHM